MVTCILALAGFVLLFVDPNLTALTWYDFPSLKFFLNLITYQIDHADFWHFFGNWTFMAPYAIYLEHRLGSARFLCFYLIAGIMSAFVFWMSGQSAIGMIGSSGSAFGVFAAACLAFNDKPWKATAGFLWLGIMLCLQFMFAVDPNPFSNVAYWGHLGGAAAGAVLAYYLLPFRGHFLEPEAPESKPPELPKAPKKARRKKAKARRRPRA